MPYVNGVHVDARRSLFLQNTIFTRSIAVQTSRFVIAFSLLTVAILFLGCQLETPPEGMPELYPVSVTILQEGMPLSNASIRLIPEDGTNPWYSGGTTDEHGVAVIQTHGKYAGAPAGSYKVTVSKIEMPAPASSDLSPLDAPPSANEPTYDLVPAQYTYPNQTPLQITVGAGENQHEFDLGAAVRIERTGPPSL